MLSHDYWKPNPSEHGTGAPTIQCGGLTARAACAEHATGRTGVSSGQNLGSRTRNKTCWACFCRSGPAFKCRLLDSECQHYRHLRRDRIVTRTGLQAVRSRSAAPWQRRRFAPVGSALESIGRTQCGSARIREPASWHVVPQYRAHSPSKARSGPIYPHVVGVVRCQVPLAGQTGDPKAVIRVRGKESQDSRGRMRRRLPECAVRSRNRSQRRIAIRPPKVVPDYGDVNGVAWLSTVDAGDYTRRGQEQGNNNKNWNDRPSKLESSASVNLHRLAAVAADLHDRVGTS